MVDKVAKKQKIGENLVDDETKVVGKVEKLAKTGAKLHSCWQPSNLHVDLY